MLTDSIEIEIISKAKQKNVRDPERSRQHFERIYDDFFGSVNYRNKTFLDLGPGQYDFGVLAELRGAKTVGFDNDPAVLELGKHKGTFISI
jgi:ribosomal protein L11 methylase PrmA